MKISSLTTQRVTSPTFRVPSLGRIAAGCVAGAFGAVRQGLPPAEKPRNQRRSLLYRVPVPAHTASPWSKIRRPRPHSLCPGFRAAHYNHVDGTPLDRMAYPLFLSPCPQRKAVDEPLPVAIGSACLHAACDPATSSSPRRRCPRPRPSAMPSGDASTTGREHSGCRTRNAACAQHHPATLRPRGDRLLPCPGHPTPTKPRTVASTSPISQAGGFFEKIRTEVQDLSTASLSCR